MKNILKNNRNHTPKHVLKTSRQSNNYAKH